MCGHHNNTIHTHTHTLLSLAAFSGHWTLVALPRTLAREGEV